MCFIVFLHFYLFFCRCHIRINIGFVDGSTAKRVLSPFVFYFCLLKQIKGLFVLLIKYSSFDRVWIRVGTPLFFAKTVLLTAHARNTPPPGTRGKGAGERVAGLGWLAGLGGWARLGWLS